MPTTSKPRTLIAIGGNALYDEVTGDNIHLDRLQVICETIAGLIAAGYQPVVTFGNGPQVGSLYNMAESSVQGPQRRIPLDVCVAWTQAEIGYAFSSTLNSLFLQQGLKTAKGTPLQTIALNTTVVVDQADPAFQNPTKPIGHFISPTEAERLYLEKGWIVGPDANRGYRRKVPSPMPLEILEVPAILAILNEGYIPLCCGGGGIPVTQSKTGYQGIEAVIDKDFTSCLIAKSLGLDVLMICTAVPELYKSFGTPEQKSLRKINTAETHALIAAGEFPPGSMGPKVAALVDFVEDGIKHNQTRRAIMTDLDHVLAAMAGEAGTEIVPVSFE